MLRIKSPELEKKAENIFEECAKDFDSTKNDYTDRALKYTDDVKKCSEDYYNKVPNNIDKLYSPDVTSDKSIFDKIYDQRFAKQKTVGRKYYDIIMANAKNICPVCGTNTPTNLDHFLPISKYPLLCVTPINLIPTCKDCNMTKNASTSDDYYELPFHPYLETINDCFLKCSIAFYSDGTVTFKFENGYSGDNDLKRKYMNHIKINALDKTYKSKALDMLLSDKHSYRDTLTSGKSALLASLKSHKDSADKRDINSWRSAVYCELYNKIDEFCEWLDTPDT